MEGEGVAEVTPIGRARRQLDPEGRARLAAGLRAIAQAIETDDLAAGHPYAVAVAILTDDLPSAWYTGVTERDDVTALQRVFVAIGGAFWRPKDAEPKTLEELVQDAHRRDLAVEAHHEAQRAAARAANPWSCEYCRRRFKSERGATQHERRCWRNPGAAQYGPGGKYRPLQVSDGIAHGLGLRVDREGEVSCSEALPRGVSPGVKPDEE